MKVMNKKSVTIGVSLLTLAGILAGCGTGGNNAATTNTTTSTTNTTTASTGPVDYSKASGTITWAASPITHTGMRQALIDAFEKAYPNIKITLQNQNSDTDTNKASLTTAIGGGSATPDVYLGDVVWPAQFASNQLAMPLNNKLPASFFNRFAGGLVQGATYKKNVYAAPFFVDSGFLFYRKDLLKQANLPVPTTWEQVQQESQTLQQKKLVQYGLVWQGASYEGLTCDFMEYLTDAGGKVFDSSGQPSIDSPQANKALTFMKGLITSGVSPKAEDTFQESQSMNVFSSGNAAFLRNWSYAWSVSTTKGSNVIGKVGVVPLPTFASSGGGSGYSTIGGWDLYVNPHTANLNASLQFIDWMTGKDAQTLMAEKFGEIPTNAAVQADPQVRALSPVLNIVSQTHYISRPSSSPNYSAVSKAIYTNVNQALAGGMSVSNALKKAQQEIKSAQGNSGL